MKHHPNLGGVSTVEFALGSPLGSCLVVASAWEVEQSGDFVCGKIRLGTKGEMVTKMGMEGNPHHFLQQYFLHKLLVGCGRPCSYTTQL